MEINNSTNFNYGQKLAALLLITGVICSVAWLSPQHNESRQISASKTKAKGDNKKISKVEKFQALFVSPAVIKDEQTILVKSQTKKAANKNERQLKELKDLNLKEITALEYKRLNLLLQESKKEISRKRLDKYNVNKFFLANGATFTRSLFDNANASYKAVLNNVEFKGQQLSIQDLQKLQAEFEKAQYSFSFDCVEMQNQIKEVLNSNHIKEAFNSRQLKPAIYLKQSIKEAEVEKIIDTEVQNSAEKKLRRVYVNRVPATVTGSNGRSVYVVDSLMAKETRLTHYYRAVPTVSSNIVTTVKNKTAAEAELAYAYNGDVILVDGKILQPSQGKKSLKLSGSNGSQAPGSVEVSGFTYHVNPNSNHTAPKINAGKTKTQPQRNENIRIDFKNKNGVIVINGKKIDLPETHDIVAISLKGKKLLSKAKNLMEIHIED